MRGLYPQIFSPFWRVLDEEWVCSGGRLGNVMPRVRPLIARFNRLSDNSDVREVLFRSRGDERNRVCLVVVKPLFRGVAGCEQGKAGTEGSSCAKLRESWSSKG